MPDHTGSRNRPSFQDSRQKTLERGHLGLGERVTALVVEFNPDGSGIDVVLPLPFACSGVPGPILFANHLPDRPVRPDQVMCRDLVHRIT